jgi:hypothetical protein
LSRWTAPGYTELKQLGSGGFGSVVLARHDATGTAVAIKYLLPELRGDPDFAAMFRAEAEALGALDDPYVVRLYEYVESAAGAAIVMELIDGVTLWDIISARGHTTPESALVVLYGALLGLAAAHARGVVHRDFKPRNVLVNAYGASKLTDFGIAARAGTPTVPSGSVAYAPPEQFDGGPATPASDVYAATATFYECLAGRPPFTGTTRESVIWQHHSAEVPMDPVPAPLQPIVARGMAKYPRYRPADAAALAAELRAAAVGAYGADWEQRGRAHLGEAALLLAALWPSAGVPAFQAFSAEQVRLSQGTRHAHGAQAAHHPVSQAGLHRWHLRHVRHLDHLEHLRAVSEQRGTGAARTAAQAGRKPAQAGRAARTAVVAVTAAAVVAAAVTVAATGHRASPPAAAGGAGQPGVSVYPVALRTIPLTAASGQPVTNGDVYVQYDAGSASTAQLSGEIGDAVAGEVVRVYAQPFPFTSAPAPVGQDTLSPAGGGAAYTFQVTPTTATHYQVSLFSSASATTPLAQSAVSTIYVLASFTKSTSQPCSAGEACQVTFTDTVHQPASTLATEMAKPWFVYVAPSQGTGQEPETLPLDPNAVVSAAHQLSADSYTRTISYSYTADSGQAYVRLCFKDTEAQDGTGLPNASGCGDPAASSASYLG